MLTATRTLRVFANPHEAEIMRVRLDAAGILSVINGAEVAAMLSHIGTAIAKVRLEVAPEDFDRAQEILLEDERRRGELSDWTCVRCDEVNDASFDLCWNCSKRRTPADPESLGEPVDESDAAIDPVFVDRASSTPPNPSTNPYAPPYLSTSDALQRPTVPRNDVLLNEPDEELRKIVSRLWIGSVFCPILLPPLVAIYILFMLSFNVPGEAYHYSGLRKRLIAAWVIASITLLFSVVGFLGGFLDVISW